MTVFFSGDELIKVAVQNEETGYGFYKLAEKNAKSQKMKEFFGFLAGQELVHKEKFLNLLKDVRIPSQPGEPADREEIDLYIKAMTDSHLFAGKDKNIVMATEASNEKSAVDYAVGFEKDTLLFFYQLEDLVHSIHKPMVQVIINEEKQHIRKLVEIRRELK
jgi:rubrerythrin